MGKHSFGKMGLFQEIRKASKNPPTKVFYWHKSFCKVPFIKKTKDFILFFPHLFLWHFSISDAEYVICYEIPFWGVGESQVVVLTSTTTSCASKYNN